MPKGMNGSCSGRPKVVPYRKRSAQTAPLTVPTTPLKHFHPKVAAKQPAAPVTAKHAVTPAKAKVVVAPWQVEEELPDGQEAEPATGPLEEVRGAEAGVAEHRVEQEARIDRRRRPLRTPSARRTDSFLGPGSGRRHPYSAEMR